MHFNEVYQEKQMSGTLLTIWRTLHQDSLALIGLYGVILLLLLVVSGSWLSPYALDQQFLGYQLLPPSWSTAGNVTFFLGTDDLGRDLLSRLLNGVAPTFGSAFIVTLGASLLGIAIGITAGMNRGWSSSLLHHLFDTLLAIPSLLLAIVIASFVGPQLKHAMLAVWLALLPHVVRVVYRAVHDELEKEYVVAALLDGATTWTILREAILPNIAPILVVEITRVFSIAILDMATLGFLDLGAQLPSTEWGAMMSDSLELVYVAPWCIMLPGAAIALSVLLVNLLGDGLRRAIIAENE